MTANVWLSLVILLVGGSGSLLLRELGKIAIDMHGDDFVTLEDDPR